MTYARWKKLFNLACDGKADWFWSSSLVGLHREIA